MYKLWLSRSRGTSLFTRPGQSSSREAAEVAAYSDPTRMVVLARLFGTKRNDTDMISKAP